jgi:phospholipid/cholesterol/gamma-HCH transport system ATP-binding protein
MIQLTDIHKSFGPKTVLSGITMAVPTGETVWLKHIVRLLTPDSGQVEVDGRNIAALDRKELFALRRRIGYVFQGAALFDSLTVYGNIIIGLFEHGERDTAKMDAEARRTLSAVGLLPDIAESGSPNFEKEYQILSNKKPSDLSGGMRKRVGVARALVGSPDYIFYDEPTTGLDPVTSEQIDNLIADLARKFKVTSLVITHDMFSVFRIADRVIMLDGGRVHFEGTAKEMHTTNDAVVKEFIERYTEHGL